MKYQELLIKVKATVDSITEIKESFYYPETDLTKFPCAIILPGNCENTFETVEDNMKTYRFRIWIVSGIGGTTVNNVFATVLPKVVDAVYDKFDADWDQGTIDGHRVWARIESEEWQVISAQDGTMCYAPMILTIKLLTNN